MKNLIIPLNNRKKIKRKYKIRNSQHNKCLMIKQTKLFRDNKINILEKRVKNKKNKKKTIIIKLKSIIILNK